MQINHSENCGKCHGNHWYGVDCKGVLLENWEQYLNFSFDITKHKSSDQIIIYEDLKQKYEDNYLLLRNEPDNTIYSCYFPWSSPNDLRKLGWSIAVHNDYKLNGENYTFWLMTKNNIALKGEGKTDEEALNQIREQILRGNIV